LINAETTKALVSLSCDLDTIKRLISTESEKTRQHVTDVQKTAELNKDAQARRKQFLDSLWFDSINARRSQIEDSFSGTFDWVFEDNENGIKSSIRMWMNSEDPLFWISGKAGSGKSTLMKFIVKDERTVEQLNQQLKDYVVYSYFIWNSDTVMQRTLKGLYCSLLHQVFQKHPQIMTQFLDSHISLNEKRSPSDWELPELKNTLKESLRSHNQQVCLFMDGLDEFDRHITPLDFKEVTQNLLNSAPGLKICVSSRPEPVWKSQLAKFPSVRLQDLTYQDMKKVAQGFLPDFVKILSESSAPVNKDEFIDRLLKKAEGVFLWLRLAINSLRRGLSNNDDWETLQNRINALPSDLNLMYKEMWDRLGDDIDIYKDRAALYFSLILEWSTNPFSYHLGGWPSLFHLTAACSTRVQENIFRGKDEYIWSQALADECRKTNRQIESECAGFLEAYFEGMNEDIIAEQLRPAVMARGFNPLSVRVGFIHRTAKDFLLYTSEGQSLIERCTLDSIDIICLLAKALLCEVFASRRSKFDLISWSHLDNAILGRGGWRPWGDINLAGVCALLANIQANSKVWQRESPKLLEILREAFNWRSQTQFHETVASYGLIQPTREFLESQVLPVETLKCARSYLLWQGLHHSVNFDRNSLTRWILSEGPNLEWQNVHIITFGREHIYRMLTFAESTVVSCFPPEYFPLNVPWISSDVLRLIPKLLESYQRNNRKILISRLVKFEVPLTSGVVQGVPIDSIAENGSEITDEQSEDPLIHNFELLIEIELPQLLFELSKSLTPPQSLALDSFPAGLRGQDILCEMTGTSGNCRGRAILMGVSVDKAFEDGSGWRFYVVPETHSEELLKAFDTLRGNFEENGHLVKRNYSDKLRPHVSNFLMLQATIKAEGSELLTNVSSWLSERGHFVPSKDDIAELESKNSFEDRFNFLDDLNRRKDDWESAQKLCAQSNLAEDHHQVVEES
jgi:hypothetical protein